MLTWKKRNDGGALPNGLHRQSYDGYSGSLWVCGYTILRKSDATGPLFGTSISSSFFDSIWRECDLEDRPLNIEQTEGAIREYCQACWQEWVDNANLFTVAEINKL